MLWIIGAKINDFQFLLKFSQKETKLTEVIC